MVLKLSVAFHEFLEKKKMIDSAFGSAFCLAS